MNWIETAYQMPDPRKRCYIVVQTSTGKRFQTMAEYIEPKSVPFDEYCDTDYPEFAQYDEENDMYWTPEGWYEWASEAETNYQVSEKVTHWMPLFELPM